MSDGVGRFLAMFVGVPLVAGAVVGFYWLGGAALAFMGVPSGVRFIVGVWFTIAVLAALGDPDAPDLGMD